MLAQQRLLRVGEPERNIVDVANRAGLGIACGLRGIVAFPDDHGDERQQHRKSHADNREYRRGDVIVPAPEFERQQGADRQSEQDRTECRGARHQEPDTPERVLVDHARMHHELHGDPDSSISFTVYVGDRGVTATVYSIPVLLVARHVARVARERRSPNQTAFRASQPNHETQQL